MEEKWEAEIGKERSKKGADGVGALKAMMESGGCETYEATPAPGGGALTRDLEI